MFAASLPPRLAGRMDGGVGPGVGVFPAFRLFSDQRFEEGSFGPSRPDSKGKKEKQS